MQDRSGGHTYTYDAEGNLVLTDNGSTEKQYFDAFNHRVRVDILPTNQKLEFATDLAGRRVSIWDATTGVQYQGNYYWGAEQLALYPSDNKLHFQHSDWLATERMRTSYNGAVETTIASLPFEDGINVGGLHQDTPYFGGMQQDPNSNMNLAQYRQYSEAQGRWLSPDPYDGSYDASNPQSFNRYSYVLNSPLSAFDPDGEDTSGPGLCYYTGSGCGSAGGGGGVGGGGTGLGQMQLGYNSTYTSVTSDAGTYFYAGDLISEYQVVDPGAGIVVDLNGNILCGGSLCGTLSVSSGIFMTQYGAVVTSGVGGERSGVSAPSKNPSQPVKSQSSFSRYAAFFGCYYISTIEQITNEEDGQSPIYFGVIDSLALIALKGGLGPLGIVPVAGAALSHIGVAAKANIECTQSVYGH